MKKYIIAILLVFCWLIISPMNPKDITYADIEDLQCKSVYLMDCGSGQVLFEQDADKQLPVASIVKLMTILITFEQIDDGKIALDDTVVASSNAAGMGGSQVFIEMGGSYTVEDLIKSVIVCSANDASVALAEHISGSEENFVKLMNNKASELGLTHTQYMNCTGLPTTDQFSTARDIAKLLVEVIKHDKYFDYSTIWIDKLTHSGDRVTELVNTNKLIRYYNGCDGGKTGSTNEAGYCLAATAKRGDMRLVGVVLGANNGKDRFAKTSEVLNYGFNTFVNKKVLAKGDVIENNTIVKGGKSKVVELICNEDMYYLQHKNDNKEIEIKYDIKENINAPVKAGDVVGQVYVIVDGVVINETNIVASADINKATYIDMLSKISDNWSIR